MFHFVGLNCTSVIAICLTVFSILASIISEDTIMMIMMFLVMIMMIIV